MGDVDENISGQQTKNKQKRHVNKNIALRY